MFRQIDDPYGLSHTLRRRVCLATVQEDYSFGHRLLEEALMRARQGGDRIAMAEVHFRRWGTLQRKLDLHPGCSEPLQEQTGYHHVEPFRSGCDLVTDNFARLGSLYITGLPYGPPSSTCAVADLYVGLGRTRDNRPICDSKARFLCPKADLRR